MGTRSVIARAESDIWTGVYCHWDGYPEGNGARLWELYHGHFGENLSAMLQFLINKHRGGWSSLHGDPTKKPGGGPRGAIPPSGVNLEEWYQQQPMPCYCHTSGGRKVPAKECGDALITSVSDDDINTEWAYVFGEAAHTMTIEVRLWNGELADAKSKSWWQVVASFSLHAEEPDWHAIQERGWDMRDAARSQAKRT